jgi:anti-anti-sigma factor
MQITHEKRGKYLIIKADGRLDASWSEYFAETVLNHIRSGKHHLIVDSGKLSFLSSAGIRSLIIIYKELMGVKGSFQIAKANPFVAKTLETTGFKSWLSNEPIPKSHQTLAGALQGIDSDEVYTINQQASLKISVPVNWQPWQAISDKSVAKLRFPQNSFALGIGTSAESDKDARQRFGEFLAIGGNVVFQPPEDGQRPDYLFSEKNFIPEMNAIQTLYCSGEMSHLFRFSPENEKLYFSLGELAERVLDVTKSVSAGFVILGEIEGLVGTYLIKSPGKLAEEKNIFYPEIREWISFSGERVFPYHQALLFGLAVRSDEQLRLFPEARPENEIYTHIHAAVFPYQTLQNGEIEMQTSLQKFLNGPPPLALFHLVDDSRSAVGLGESALIRGACWCSSINNPEALL